MRILLALVMFFLPHLVSLPAFADPANIVLTQSADKRMITATWEKTATDLTTVQWDVTSDRPVFGHKFVNEPTRSTTWRTDTRSCDTGWMYTVTGYSSSGAQVGSPSRRLFFPQCPPEADAPAPVLVTNSSPLPVREVSPVPYPTTGSTNYYNTGSSGGIGIEDQTNFGNWSDDYSNFIVSASFVAAGILLLVALYVTLGRKALLA